MPNQRAQRIVPAESQEGLEDISEMALRVREGADSRVAIAELAQDWIEANRDQVDAWLQAARAGRRWLA